MSVDLEQSAILLYGHYRVSRSPAWEDLEPDDRQHYRNFVRENEERAYALERFRDCRYGAEAEELRKGIEDIIAECAADELSDDEPVVCPNDLRQLLDRVDARDSLRHLETVATAVKKERDRCAQLIEVLMNSTLSQSHWADAIRATPEDKS